MKRKTAAILIGATALYLVATKARRVINNMSLRFGGFSVLSSDVEKNSSNCVLRLLVGNAAPFSLTVDAIRGDLYVQGAKAATINQRLDVKLIASGVTTVDLLFDILWSGVAAAIKNNILSGNVRTLSMQFVGSFVVAGRSIPVNKSLTYYDLV